MRWYRALSLVIVAVAAGGFATSAQAQATGLPSFNAPYRAFNRSEIGLVLTFPDPGGTAFEGVYRIAQSKFDIGFRGGIYTPGGGGSSVLLIGAEARERVVTHTEDFPLDGALILGIGGGSSVLLIGAEARERVVTHTEDFPLDGALILGIGGEFVSGRSEERRVGK